MFEPVVRAMHDLVDRKGRGGTLRMVAVPGGERLGDLVKPFVEQRRLAAR